MPVDTAIGSYAMEVRVVQEQLLPADSKEGKVHHEWTLLPWQLHHADQ